MTEAPGIEALAEVEAELHMLEQKITPLLYIMASEGVDNSLLA